MVKKTKYCLWLDSKYGVSYFDTKCNYTFFYSGGAVSGLGFRFCPFCGKVILRLADSKKVGRSL